MQSGINSEDFWSERLQTFHRCAQQRNRLSQLRAVIYGGLLVGLFNLAFVVFMNPHSSLWIFLSMASIPVCLVFAPLVSVAFRRAERQRNALATEFFQAGFRVDEDGHLITNHARPTLITSASFGTLVSGS